LQQREPEGIHQRGRMAGNSIKVNGINESQPSPAEPPAGSASPLAADFLDSWKEIAVYLERDIRTVQRWEKFESLPVHRHVHEKQGTVFAYRSEIDIWRKSREIEPIAETLEETSEVERPAPAALQPDPGNSTKVSRSWNFGLLISAVVLAITVVAMIAYYPKITNPMASVPNVPLTVAVLPFENLSADPAEEYFSDGMTEEVIVQLGRMQVASVNPIAVSSSNAYKKSNKSLQKIASELGAQFVVQGSVRRSGNQVRISAHLVRAEDDRHLWDDNYDRDMKDVLELQADVAEAIANGISGNLATRRAGVVRPLNPDAYEAYLRGRYFWNKRTPEELGHAMLEFNKAIAIDPTYAPAYVGISDCYTLLASAQMGILPPRDAMPKAKEMAEKALYLDSSLAEAHASLAHVILIYDRDGAKAENEFQRAIELNPAYATAHQWYALYFNAVGRTSDALEQLKQSKKLDPVSPAIHTALAEAYYFDRQYANSMQEAQKALDIDPNFALGYLNMGRALEQLARYDEAISAFEKGKAVAGKVPAITTLIARAYALKGDKAQARLLLQQLLTTATVGGQPMYVPSIYIATIYNALGEQEKSVVYLKKALDEKCEYLIYLDRDPMADSIRSDPRFKQILSEARLRDNTHFVPPKMTPY
jgi:TolB-like protein/Tfp pilus assembly protein PilF